MALDGRVGNPNVAWTSSKIRLHLEEVVQYIWPMNEDFPNDIVACAVELAEGGQGRPLFLVHGGSGNLINLVGLAHEVAGIRPDGGAIYGFEAAGLRGGAMDGSVRAMAARYVAATRAIAPTGPYLLGGFSIGGGIALEMAAQLCDDGHQVAGVVLLDAHPSLAPPLGENQLAHVAKHLRSEGLRAIWPWARRQFWWKLGRRSDPQMLARLGYNDPASRGEQACEATIFALGRTHAHDCLRPVEVDVILIKSGELWPGYPTDHGWGPYVKGRLTVALADGDHLSMLDAPHHARLARTVAGQLDQWCLG